MRQEMGAEERRGRDIMEAEGGGGKGGGEER